MIRHTYCASPPPPELAFIRAARNSFFSQALFLI
jgi:hypothetical protein